MRLPVFGCYRDSIELAFVEISAAMPNTHKGRSGDLGILLIEIAVAASCSGDMVWRLRALPDEVTADGYLS